jgi:glutaconate CoA-transferase subunit A
VCHVPDGAHPSFAMGYSERDNAFYKAWDDISKSRETFTDWVGQHIMSTDDYAGYRRSTGLDLADVQQAKAVRSGSRV